MNADGSDSLEITGASDSATDSNAKSSFSLAAKAVELREGEHRSKWQYGMLSVCKQVRWLLSVGFCPLA
jgi:hypothetical protein